MARATISGESGDPAWGEQGHIQNTHWQGTGGRTHTHTQEHRLHMRPLEERTTGFKRRVRVGEPPAPPETGWPSTPWIPSMGSFLLLEELPVEEEDEVEGALAAVVVLVDEETFFPSISCET